MQQSTTPRKPASTRVLAPAEITPLSEINNVTGPTGEQRECSMCRTDRRICDGGRPCARCVTYGFQCRDVRKRGRPKKDQEDKSLAVQDHPLFSEWSLGGAGAKPQEGPRKKRRGSRSGGSGSAAAVVNKSGRHTSAASLRPGETLPISKKNLDTVFRGSPIAAGNSLTTATTQRKDDTGGPVPERQAGESYPASTDSSNAASPASYRPAYSSVYPYYALDRDPNYLRQQTPSSKESAFKPSAEQTSKGLEAELQRYREQYRMLYASEASKQQRGLPSDFPSTSSSSQQQQQQRDFPGFRVGQDNTVFTPFYNTLQELMRHGDGKPNSVVMREEVVCVDSVQTPPSNNKNNNTANEKSKDVASRPPETSFMETEPTSSHMGSYQPSSSSFNYRYPPSSLYSSSFPKPQSESQDQSAYRRPYYPYATPSIPNFGSRSDPGVRPTPASYNPYEDRRSAWDFSSSSPKLASQLNSMDRPPFPPFNPSASSSPSSSTTSSSSTASTPSSVPPPNSSLLRLLASYDS